MKKPLVAIVGRPNVGKSTFFNKICGRRISIVDDTPGVTRDRVYADAEWCGYMFTLVDTGGLDMASSDLFQQDIKTQAEIAVELADVIIFMVDGRQGLTPNDYEVAEFLRKTSKPVLLVVNKLDNFEVEQTFDFYTLGFENVFALSCLQSKGLGEVLDAITDNFKEKNLQDLEDNSIKIAVVGRPNAGKSSITNRILGEKRVVVSSSAGTTRDAIDTPFRFNAKDYTIIDTAGLRRKRGVEQSSIESYSVIRAYEAIKRADIVLVVFDASEEITEQDVRIAGYVHEENKPSVIVMNKWDAVDKNNKSINDYEKMLQEKLAFMSYFKSVYVSALDGTRFGKIMETVEIVLENTGKRIPTGALNEFLSNALLTNEPPYRNGRRLKINYVTQAQTNPPTFVLFCNDPALMHFSYLRYLENKLRESIDFKGTPIKFILRGNKKED